jgi:hypothetical protein
MTSQRRPSYQMEGMPYQMEGMPYQMEGSRSGGLGPQGDRWATVHLYRLYHPKGYSAFPWRSALNLKTTLAGSAGGWSSCLCSR